MLDFEQRIGDPRRFSAVTKVGAQDFQFLLMRQRLVTPEQAFDLAPGEEVGMDDLIGIATQQEMVGLFQGREDQGELYVGKVLYFVNDYKIVEWHGQIAPLAGDEVNIEEIGFSEPSPVFLK